MRVFRFLDLLQRGSNGTVLPDQGRRYLLSLRQLAGHKRYFVLQNKPPPDTNHLKVFLWSETFFVDGPWEVNRAHI